MSAIPDMPQRGIDRERWRFLLDESHDGPTNMAIDEVMGLGCSRGWSPPSLRVYRWSLPTVSLGYNQSIQGDVDLTTCRQQGIPVVRRPTGGRALLHHHELTYSVTLPVPPGGRGVLHDYQWISHCLVLALRRLGVAATLSRGDRMKGEAAGLCFISSSRYELTVNGRKLIGSAQRRFSRALLQHGSILIDIDYPTWTTLFPQAKDLEARATALTSILGRPPSWEALAQALRGGFEEGANVSFEVGALTRRERAVVRESVRERYGTSEWTLRR